MALMIILGGVCIGISLWDKFAEPRFRALRAGKLSSYGYITLMYYYSPVVTVYQYMYSADLPSIDRVSHLYL